MPYEATTISPGEWIGISLTFITLLAGQWWAIVKVLQGKFDKQEEAVKASARERVEAQEKAREDNAAKFLQVNGELARLDRELIKAQGRLDALPTKDQIEALLDKRFGHLEVRFERQDEKFDRLINMMLRRGPDDDS